MVGFDLEGLREDVMTARRNFRLDARSSEVVQKPEELDLLLFADIGQRVTAWSMLSINGIQVPELYLAGGQLEIYRQYVKGARQVADKLRRRFTVTFFEHGDVRPLNPHFIGKVTDS